MLRYESSHVRRRIRKEEELTMVAGMFVSAEEVFQSLLKEESDEIFIDYRDSMERVRLLIERFYAIN